MPRNYRDRPQTAGLNSAVEQLYNRFPLRLPLVLIGLGLIVVLLGILQYTRYGGKFALFAIPVAVILLGSGILVLPFGFKKWSQRKLHPVVLTCPKCGVESRTLATPFNVQRWADVNYAYVTCSMCGKDFTVSRYARLL